ncbi:unnamed protein product, partial [Oppiella nova]
MFPMYQKNSRLLMISSNVLKWITRAGPPSSLKPFTR